MLEVVVGVTGHSVGCTGSVAITGVTVVVIVASVGAGSGLSGVVEETVSAAAGVVSLEMSEGRGLKMGSC